jgi:hypothetical protein
MKHIECNRAFFLPYFETLFQHAGQVDILRADEDMGGMGA